MGRAANRKWHKRSKMLQYFIRSRKTEKALEMLRNLKRVTNKLQYDWNDLKRLMAR